MNLCVSLVAENFRALCTGKLLLIIFFITSRTTSVPFLIILGNLFCTMYELYVVHDLGAML